MRINISFNLDSNAQSDKHAEEIKRICGYVAAEIDKNPHGNMEMLESGFILMVPDSNGHIVAEVTCREDYANAVDELRFSTWQEDQS